MSDSVSQKWCPRCEKTKDLNAFREDKALKDGYRKYCKNCSDTRKRTCRECKVVMIRDEMVQSNLHSSLYYCKTCWSNLQGKKKCIGCKEIKDIDEFNLDRSRLDGREYYCKTCSKDKHDKKYAKEVLKKGTKRCLECKKAKSLCDFEEDRRSKDGFSVQCKDCLSGNIQRKQDIDASRKYQDFTISPSGSRHIQSRYGITIMEYRRLFEEQKGVCAICGGPELTRKHKRLSVDHCHKTGKVRGLLCSSCNFALGALNETIDYFQSAIEYLQSNE